MLGAKHIGKSYLLRAVAYLNTTLSPHTLSVVIDARACDDVSSLSVIIADTLLTRIPSLRESEAAIVDNFGSDWKQHTIQVSRVMTLVAHMRVFVVVDELDRLFMRVSAKRMIRS